MNRLSRLSLLVAAALLFSRLWDHTRQKGLVILPVPMPDGILNPKLRSIKIDKIFR